MRIRRSAVGSGVKTPSFSWAMRPEAEASGYLLVGGADAWGEGGWISVGAVRDDLLSVYRSSGQSCRSLRSAGHGAVLLRSR